MIEIKPSHDWTQIFAIQIYERHFGLKTTIFSFKSVTMMIRETGTASRRRISHIQWRQIEIDIVMVMRLMVVAVVNAAEG